MQGIATLPYEVQNQPVIPMGGLETMESAAKMLADFGREGDTYIVHAAEGETVVPLEVLEANPRMKQMIFQQMEDMGLDPERYVVGSELNSLNPVTGQPEFFFKKIFRKIKKVVKKVAPVVLPVALSFVAGPIYGAALGSGINTLLQGGSLKDAAKSALISGGIGAIGAGFTGTQGGFLKNIQYAAGSPLQAAAAQREAFGKLFGGSTTPQDVGAMKPDSFGQTVPKPKLTADQIADVVGEKAISDQALADIAKGSVKEGTEKSILDKGKNLFEQFVYDPAPNVVTPTGSTGEATLESIFSPSRTSITQGGQAVAAGAEEVAKQNQILTALGKDPLSEEAAKTLLEKTAMAAETTAPTFLQKATPLALAGTGLVGTKVAMDLADQFTDQDQDGMDDYTGLSLDQYKEQYPDRFFGAGFYGDNPYYQDPTFLTPMQMAAGGGAINGPGTSTSDSIPAMLSDGEFVMNAKAVRGAGEGDRKAGAQRMYDMMRKFERMA